MTITWDRDNQTAGFHFDFGGWLYTLHHGHVIMAENKLDHDDLLLIIGRYK